MKTLLLIDPDLTAGFDLEKLKPLGSRADVTRRIQRAFGPHAAVKIEIAAEEPARQVAVILPSKRDVSFEPLRRLCDQTGWRLFDRDAGRFLDLSAPEPLSTPTAAPPMFQWWTGLPSGVRVFIGFAVAFAIFYIYVLNWVLSWH